MTYPISIGRIYECLWFEHVFWDEFGPAWMFILFPNPPLFKIKLSNYPGIFLYHLFFPWRFHINKFMHQYSRITSILGMWLKSILYQYIRYIMWQPVDGYKVSNI